MNVGFLDRLLATLEVSVSAFAICKVAKGWSLALEGTSSPLLHYVLKGTGRARFEKLEPINFSAHDFIIIPADTPHWIEAPDGSAREVRASDQRVTLVDGMLDITGPGGNSADVASVCGVLQAKYGGAVGVFDGLSSPLTMHLEPGNRLRQVFETVIEELADPKIGSHSLAEALLKQCLILLVRSFAEDPESAPWLFGAADPRLLRILIEMVENPARDYSLDQLARSAGMSRSGLAAHFHGTFGQPPIEFLKELRLHRAARLLERTDLPISLISQSIGYKSRTYFSRAFRQRFGVDPRRYRQERRNPPPALPARMDG